MGVPEALDGPDWPGVETGGEPEAGGAVDELGRTEVLPEAGDAGPDTEDEGSVVNTVVNAVVIGAEPLLGLVMEPKDTGTEAVYDGAGPPGPVADTIDPPGFVVDPPGTPGIELDGTPGSELEGTPGSDPGGMPGVPVVVTGGTIGV